MAIRSRAVRKSSSQTGSPVGPARTDSQVFASLQKREAFLGPPRFIRLISSLRSEATLKRHFVGGFLFHRRKPLCDPLKPATLGLHRGKMYGFPTVRNMDPIRPASGSTSGHGFGRRSHDRVPRRPRARESIPHHTVETRNQYLRLARTYIPIHNPDLIQ